MFGLFDPQLKKETKAHLVRIGHTQMEATMALRSTSDQTWKIVDSCLNPLDSYKEKSALAWMLILEMESKHALRVGNWDKHSFIRDLQQFHSDHKPTMELIDTISDETFELCLAGMESHNMNPFSENYEVVV